MQKREKIPVPKKIEQNNTGKVNALNWAVLFLLTFQIQILILFWATQKIMPIKTQKSKSLNVFGHFSTRRHSKKAKEK